jgi:3-oxoacyl-[acyl-carrier-protein] synthase-3
VTKENIDLRLNTLKMNGKETFKQAVTAMAQASLEVIEQAGISIDDIACIIPHQANIRIIDAIADRLKIRQDRFMVNLDRYGNTGAAAVGIALDEARRTRRVKAGDKILMVVFGSGLTWASAVVEL